MKNLDDLLDAVKLVTGSDYRTAKEIDTKNQLIGNWRGRVSMPSNKHIIGMCKLANINLADAIIAVEYSRENERPLREAGFVDLNVLLGMSAASLGALTLLKMSALPYDSITAWILSSGSLYIM